MRWVHLDEAYTWMPWDGEAPTHHRNQYKYVPNELVARLDEAWRNLHKVTDEISNYKERNNV